jgi:hypothetical protein
LNGVQSNEFALGAGVVRTFESAAEKQFFFSWSGVWHEVHGSAPKTLPRHALADYLGDLDIEDSPEGLRLLSRSPMPDEFHSLSINSLLRPFGVISAEAADDFRSHQALPAWPGKRTAAGEMWRKSGDGNPTSFSLVLAAPSVVLVFHAFPGQDEVTIVGIVEAISHASLG